MIIPASKHADALNLCKNYPKDLLEFGFFSGEDVEDYQLICKTTEKYEQGEKQDSDMFVMKVAKRTSHLSLALLALDPLYVSHNTSEGAKECSAIFNENFYAHDDVEAETEDAVE